MAFLQAIERLAPFRLLASLSGHLLACVLCRSFTLPPQTYVRTHLRGYTLSPMPSSGLSFTVQNHSRHHAVITCNCSRGPVSVASFSAGFKIHWLLCVASGVAESTHAMVSKCKESCGCRRLVGGANALSRGSALARAAQHAHFSNRSIPCRDGKPFTGDVDIRSRKNSTSSTTYGT